MEGTKTLDIYLLLFCGTLIFFMLAASVVAFIYLYRKRLRQQQTAMRDMHTKLKLDLLQSNMEALETERQRFAADLHDEIGGKLATLRLTLSQLQKQGNDNPQLEQLTARSKEIIDAMIGTVRRVSHNLVPPSLELFGLASAIEELSSWINSSSAITVTTDYRLEQVILDQKKQLALYRIIQELLSNTIRHAQASHIYLALLAGGRDIQLIYKDGGRGLNLSQMHGFKGLGFKNIENRVKLIRGKVDYRSEGKGFECVISFSVN
ncbi:sensor histidine kinase [Longitalea arenae]|uniref:sensor histidine kinase n=1 Tax=Longitalea arenae TaxID=2812558 RepID=UPI0019688C40|nr:histidine kinase [Longitalea arenae]